MVEIEDSNFVAGENRSKQKKSITRLISFLLVELTLLVVLGYPNSTPLRAPILIIAFAWTVIRRCKNNNIRGINTQHLFWVISFFLLLNLSVVWAHEPQGIADVRNNVMWSAMTSIIVADYIIFYKVSAEKVAKTLAPIALFFIVNTLLFGVRDNSNRLNVSNNANTFGAIAIGMASFFMYTLFKNKKKQPIYLVLCTVLLVMSLMSGSRKAIISLFVYFISYFLFIKLNDNSKKVFIKLLIAISVVLISFALIMNVKPLYDTIGNRVETLLETTSGETEADSSINSRVNMVALAGNAIKQNPILGIGANNFKYYAYYGTYSHNGYIEILCDFGIVGAIVYYLPLVRILFGSFRKWKAKRKDAIVPLSIMIAFFICEIANVTYFSMNVYCFLGIAAGLLQLIKNNERENK